MYEMLKFRTNLSLSRKKCKPLKWYKYLQPNKRFFTMAKRPLNQALVNLYWISLEIVMGSLNLKSLRKAKTTSELEEKPRLQAN